MKNIEEIKINPISKVYSELDKEVFYEFSYDIKFNNGVNYSIHTTDFKEINSVINEVTYNALTYYYKQYDKQRNEANYYKSKYKEMRQKVINLTNTSLELCDEDIKELRRIIKEVKK
jgi:hypothetical protein